MPFRAHGVSTCGFCSARSLTITPSNSAKKNVLFLTIGPPRLPMNWFLLVQSLGVGLHPPVLGSTALLFTQVLASNALFRTNHAALPLSWLVPDFVKTCICPL